MNNLDQLVVIRHNGDEAWNGIFLFDDGQFYEIGLPFQLDNLPTTWRITSLFDDGRIAGTVTTRANAKAPISVTMDAFIITHRLPFCYNPISRGQFRDVKMLYRLAGAKDWNTVEG